MSSTTSAGEARKPPSIQRQLIAKVEELSSALSVEVQAREKLSRELDQRNEELERIRAELKSDRSPLTHSVTDHGTTQVMTRPSLEAREKEISALRKQLRIVTDYSQKQDETIASLDSKLLFVQEQAERSEASATAAVARSKRLGREAESAARKQEEAEGHTRAVDRITTKAQRLLVLLRQTERQRDGLASDTERANAELASAREAKDAALQRASELSAELIDCQRLLQEAKAVADLGADSAPVEAETPTISGAPVASEGGLGSVPQAPQEVHEGAAARSSGSTATPGKAESDGSEPQGPCPRCIALQREMDDFRRRYYDLQQRAVLATDAEAGLERRAEQAETELAALRRTAAAAEGELEREKAQRRADAAANSASMTGLREECIDLEAALRDRRQEVKRLRDAMGSIGEDASRLQVKEEKREAEIARLRASCHRLRAEAVRSAADVHKLRGEAEAEGIRARRAAQEATALRHELEAAAGRAAEAQRGARLARATAEATAAELGGALVNKTKGAHPAKSPACAESLEGAEPKGGGADGASATHRPLDALRAMEGADQVAAAVEAVFQGALGTSPQAALLAQAAGALASGGIQGTGRRGSGEGAPESGDGLGHEAGSLEEALGQSLAAASWALLGQAAADGVRGDRAGLRATRRKAAAVLARLSFTCREAVARLTSVTMHAAGQRGSLQSTGGAAGSKASVGRSDWLPPQLLGAPGSHLDPSRSAGPAHGFEEGKGGLGATAASVPSGALPVARLLFGASTQRTQAGSGSEDAVEPLMCLHASALALGDDGLASVLGALRGASAGGGEAGLQALDLRYNGITDTGASAIAGILAGSRSHARRWRLVDLRGNRLTSKGVRDLAEALRDCGGTLGVRHVLVGADGMIRGLGHLPARDGRNAVSEEDGGSGRGEERGSAAGTSATAALVAVVDCRGQRPLYEAAANPVDPQESSEEMGAPRVLHRIPEEDGSVLLSARLGSEEAAAGTEGGAGGGEQSAGASPGPIVDRDGAARGSGSFKGGSFPGGTPRGPYAAPVAVLPPLRSSPVRRRGQHAEGKQGRDGGDAVSAIDRALVAMGRSQDPMDVIRAADLAIRHHEAKTGT